MIITNKNNIPEFFVDFIKEHKHSKKGDFSATELLRSPLEIKLAKKYYSIISKDISDMLDRLIGIGVHSILENARIDGNILKEYEILIKRDDVKISGILDFFDIDKGILQDYKTTKVYKILKEDYTDWEKQLNIYAYALEQEGYVVNKLQVVAILKDYSKTEKERKENYVDSPVVIIDLQKWDKEQVEKFIDERVGLIKQYLDKDEKDIPKCEDTWDTPIIYKVYKKGNFNRSLKNFTDRDEALKYIENKDGLIIKKTGGEPKKCIHFCDYNLFCPFYLNYIKGKEEDKDDIE